MEEKNKSGQITFGTYAVIVTIVFLVLLVGILAGMLIQKNNEVKVTSTTENVATENKIDKEDTNKEENKANEIKNNKENNESDEKTPEIKGQKLVQFDNEFYGLKDVAKEYRLSENIKNYKDFNYDLDGDGVTEKITIQKNKENDGESYLFKLNGKKFDEYYHRPEIYIVDLNEKDNNIEVVIFHEGASDDPEYIIYSKKESKMLPTFRSDGYLLKTDKKGTVVFVNSHNRRLNGYTDPEIYFDYYVINNTKIEKKYINIDRIKDIDFITSLYFSEDYSNKDRFWDDYDGVHYKKRFKEVDIEELDKNTTFKVLDFKIIKRENNSEEYKIYVELSDGRKGYIFDIQLAG